MAWQTPDEKQERQGSKGIPGYVETHDRLHEFWQEMRSTKVPARIASEIVDMNDRSIIIRATIWMHFEDVGWVAIGDGLAEEMRSSAPKGKCMEVAQTSAVGRALAMAGYAPLQRIASADEMGSYYAAQNAEARENAAKAMQIAPMPEPVEPTPIKKPKPTKVEQNEVFEDQATIAQKAAKVGVVTEHGSGQGETVEQAVGEAFGKAAKARAAEPKIGNATMLDPDVAPVGGEGKRVFPTDAKEAARLAKMPPPFRKFVEKMHGYAEAGETFEQIKARFGAAKPRMSEPEVKEARHQLAILKTRCEEIAAATVDPALAEDVATELAALTDEEKAFMAS